MKEADTVPGLTLISPIRANFYGFRYISRSYISNEHDLGLKSELVDHFSFWNFMISLNIHIEAILRVVSSFGERQTSERSKQVQE